MPFREIPGSALPIKIWGEPVEEKANRQLQHVASLPFLFHHVAVMPDVHWGIGATVGTVLASRDTVIPAAVGVDIGCGVAAVRLSMDRSWFFTDERLHRLRVSIERAIPVGFALHDPEEVTPEVKTWARRNLGKGSLKAPMEREILHRARLQLGTLGGGNHFIEIGHDQQERAWVLLHSGSRHIGKKIADFYIRLAKGKLKQSGKLSLLPDPDLAYLQDHQPEFQDYLHDLYWAQGYARFNRGEMMRSVLREMALLDGGRGDDRALAQLTREQVDCHHNYVAREKHFGEMVYLTRKGAVSAKIGELGIIPGSMGAASYLVEGKGHPESYTSCAHGAGRAMSRREAKRRFTVADLKRQTEGVDCRKDQGVLDELPSAYKDITQVMAAQADLVTVRERLTQLICVKG